MLKRVEIENFRGINKCVIDDLRLINIFIGPNNSCKSTLLDAIYLGLKEPIEPSIYDVFSRRVGREVDRPELFFRYDENLIVKISLTFSDETSYTLRMYRTKESKEMPMPDGSFVSLGPNRYIVTFEDKTKEYYYHELDIALRVPSISLSTTAPSRKLSPFVLNYAKNAQLLLSCTNVADLWRELRSVLGKIKHKVDLEGDLIERLRKVYDISYYEFVPKPIKTSDILPVFTEEVPMKLRVYGAFHGMGLQRGALILSYLELLRNTALLIEEPEVYQHPRAMRMLAEHMIELAKKNKVQLFMTTHSYYDFLSVIRYAPNIELDNLRCYLLKREPEEIRVERVEKRIDKIIEAIG